MNTNTNSDCFFQEHNEAARKLIRRYFKIRTRIKSVRWAEHGINDRRHVVFRCTNGETFSLKNPSEIESRKEYVAGKIDRITGIGAVSPIRFVRIPDEFTHLGRMGVLIHWERRGIDFRRLTDRSKDGLKPLLKSRKTAFSAGVAVFIVAALSICDRHAGNFVYNPKTKRIVVIDNESAFANWNEYGFADDLIRMFCEKTSHKEQVYAGINYAADIFSKKRVDIINLVRKDLPNIQLFTLMKKSIENIRMEAFRQVR